VEKREARQRSLKHLCESGKQEDTMWDEPATLKVTKGSS